MYYALGSQVAAMRVLTSTGSTLYYLRSDHLGSTSVTMDASGTKIGEMRYKPYGEIRYTEGISPTNRQFTGQYADGNLNLVQMGARWYSPAVGRWLSPDTIVPDPASPQSLNRFTYVRNSPLNRIDPTGHCDSTADQEQDPCWIKLRQLEKDWGLEFFDTDLWELQYLEYFSDALSGVGNTVGGDLFLKLILSRSAKQAGLGRFEIHGRKKADELNRCIQGCSLDGRIWFPINEMFSEEFHTFGPQTEGNFYSESPNPDKPELNRV
jgi:RHS repeat-associated protein